MKAEINGITIEGSPEEIAQVIKLAGEALKTKIEYVPIYPYPSYPIQPMWNDPTSNKPVDRWITITC